MNPIRQTASSVPILIPGVRFIYRFCLWVFFVSSVACHSGRSWNDSDPLHELEAKANHHYVLGDHHVAIMLYDELITLDTSKGEYYHKRGLARESIHDYQGASEDYLKAIDLGYELAISYFSLSYLESNQLNDSLAMHYIDQALAIDSTNSLLQTHKSIIADRLSKSTMSMNDVQALTGSTDELLDFANTFYEKDDFPAAIRVFDKVIRVDSAMGEAFYKRGYSRMKVLDFYGAKSDFLRAVELRYRVSDAYYCLAMIFSGDDASVMYYLEKSISADPNNERAKKELRTLKLGQMPPFSGLRKLFRSIV